jgi:hypothetical protein
VALKEAYALVKVEYKPTPFEEEATTNGEAAALAAGGEEAFVPEPEIIF